MPGPPSSLNLPPLPPLVWEDYWWEAPEVLPTWAGFAVRHDEGGFRPDAVPCALRLIISPPGVFTSGPRAVAPEQVASYRQLKENESRVSAAVLEAIFAVYPAAREQAIACTVKPEHVRELEEAMPVGLTPGQLRDVVSLQTVHILPVHRDGIAYLGFSFECVWEFEHGLGVLTHLDRVVKVGVADDADDVWAARGDGGDDIAAPR